MNFKSIKNHIRNYRYTRLLIDESNRKLWKQLIKTENISIKLGDFPSYQVFSRSNNHRIDVQLNNIDIPSFSHELLHIYLTTMGVDAGSCLKIMSYSNQDTEKIFSPTLVEYMGNYLDHIKILPLFLEMGYNRETFIADYDSDRGSRSIATMIELKFKDGVNDYNSQGVEYFIGHYFSAKACPNDNNDYTDFYISLKNIDPELFEIVENFHNGWVAYDYTTPTNLYRPIIIEFIENIKKWSSNKNLV